MDILMLGGTGAMGRPLARALAVHNNKLLITTRQSLQDTDNIKFIQGDAHDKCFIESLCKKKYDVIIDFMVYTIEEFRTLSKLFLETTEQYVFMSSARVYADSSERITEISARLLDKVKDKEYLSTNEYALKKAREEDVLIHSGMSNWTIIRPYITYNTNRLQLGTLEKEYWLKRALKGMPVVLTRRTAEAYTTLTYGKDVSDYLERIIGNKKCLGQIYHIVNEETMQWKDVLGIYNEIFERVAGKPFEVIITDEYRAIGAALGNIYQMKYDRFYNRSFDSSKVKRDCAYEAAFTSMRDGISYCLEEFLADPRFNLTVNWKYEGLMDRLCGINISLSSVPGFKNKMRYYLWRNIPSSIMVLMEGFRKRISNLS